MSSNKVKGLFKGFKKLNIFDEKEDDEIEIGFPTDVKHVAHIGLDGPSASTPTWMADIQRAPGAPEIKPPPTPPTPTPNTNDTPQGDKVDNNETATKGDGIRKIKDIPKSKGDGSKASRQHRSSDPTSESSTRQSRRNRQGQGGDSSLEETNGNVAQKKHRRRKSKATNGDESVKSSRRPKGHSMTDIPLLDNESVEGSVHCGSPVLTKVA